MKRFSVTYEDESGLFPVTYDLEGTYSIQLAEPDVGIMSAYVEEVVIERVDVWLDGIEMQTAVGPDQPKIVKLFNDRMSVEKDQLREWIEEQLTDRIDEDYYEPSRDELDR